MMIFITFLGPKSGLLASHMPMDIEPLNKEHAAELLDEESFLFEVLELLDLQSRRRRKRRRREMKSV